MNVTAPRRWIVLCTMGLAVLALHAALLLLLGPAWFDPAQSTAPPGQALQVRSVALAPTMATPSAPLMPQAKHPAPAPTRVVRQAKPALAADAEPGIATVPASVAAPLSVGAGPAIAAAEVVDVPVYATRLPPPGHWRYRLQRGLALGEAELRWAPQADGRYDLQLEGHVAGVTLLDWVSRGQVDAAGIAPERFTVRRRGRDRQAVNFQREAAKITFSGSGHELPLWPGAQDRLSWMVQLPAIVAATPERFASGAAVVLLVAGARGEGDVWTFFVHGVEMLGDAPALKLVREPRRLYDTRVEVWLDPAEHYLPLRLVQTPSGGGAGLELTREREAR